MTEVLALERELSDWVKRSRYGQELLLLQFDEETRQANFILEGMYDLYIGYPTGYPKSGSGTFTFSAPSLPPLEQELKEYVKNPTLSFTQILEQMVYVRYGKPKVAPYKEEKTTPQKKEVLTRTYDDDNYDDNDNDDDIDNEEEMEDSSFELTRSSELDMEPESIMESEELDQTLEVLRKKKLWAKKVSMIKTQLKDEMKVKGRERVENIFSTDAAIGVLTNDLLHIMENKETLGFSAEPVDDNIYHWNVKMFGFSPNSEIFIHMLQLNKQFHYDYVELDVTFVVDLYPFYPPIVKIIRPRFQGFMMGRVTSMDELKLSYWDPVKDMKDILRQIRSLLEEHGKIDVNNPLNDLSSCAYSEMEYMLLKLELLSEQDPRANLKYPTAEKSSLKPNKMTTSLASKKKEGNKQSPWASGTGYGGDHCKATWDVNSYLAAQRTKDLLLENVLQDLKNLLSSSNKTNSLFLILEESCLVSFFETYLRNDSPLDIEKHSFLYSSILDLLEIIAKNDDLLPLLDTLPFQSKSVFDLLQTSSSMMNIFLKSLQKGKATSKDSSFSSSSLQPSSTSTKATTESEKIAKETENTAVIAKKFISCFKLVEKNISRLRKELKDLEKEMSDRANKEVSLIARDHLDPTHLPKIYVEVMSSLQFLGSKMDLKKHHYHSSITKSSSTHAKVLRLAQEQANLAVALPLSLDSSVFLRIDEDRIDVMQVLITGPPDTPYESGCFNFDVFFPDTYPSTPPHVNLMTTGSGTVRFNPNLYNCGKVCLSLLGTWSGAEGENWNKDTSTFLQVLVSIQSLILVPMPFFNEPGYEKQMGTPQGTAANKKYNETIRVATIEHAMIGQMKKPTPGFEDVVKRHFYLKSDLIKKRCDVWLAEAQESPSKTHYNQLLKVVKDLKDELAKLPKPESLT